MAIKIETRSGSTERQVLISIITDSVVLGKVATKWNKEGLLNSKWANMIAGWCIKFYNKYGKAPNKSIESLFQNWEETAHDKETIKLIERFLGSLSDEYGQKKSRNSDYLVDIAGKYIHKIAVTKFKEALETDLESGDIEKAQKRIDTYNKIELGTGSGIDVLNDKEVIKRAFLTQEGGLIKYPGALGSFFGDALEREGFISFSAPEKRGKTAWLLDMAYRAVLQGRRVAFFGVGDMSEFQIMRRLAARITKKPIKPGTVRYPTYMEMPTDRKDQVTVEFKKKEFKNGLTWEETWKAIQSLPQSKDKLFRMSIHPNTTISVLGIRSIIQTWEKQGWAADVLVIDYCDILAPINGQGETRDQINATWKSLRGLSQSLHCLVVTATQTNAASYKSDSIDMSNFSEDKRKYGHVTGMVGINQTSHEKKSGIFRLNWIVLREADFDTSKHVYVASCLDLAMPCVKSSF